MHVNRGAVRLHPGTELIFVAFEQHLAIVLHPGADFRGFKLRVQHNGTAAVGGDGGADAEIRQHGLRGRVCS